ncbi:MAG: septum formation protein Maf [Lachnospiraceae bacterium]|nr:septum formation protein Maf [Lachnospiraceae bacterium]
MIDWHVILASASPRRSELLKRTGIEPEVIPSDVDEDVLISDPAELVSELSERKCTDVAMRLLASQAEIPGKTVVIGADTVVAAGGKILGKPENEQDAFRMLQNLSGRLHEVLTGVFMIFIEDRKIVRTKSFAETTRVKVAALSDQEIWDYIATGEPMDKAGAYGIQGLFSRYVEGIEGDYSNVVGLPVCRIYKVFRGLKNELQ